MSRKVGASGSDPFHDNVRLESDHNGCRVRPFIPRRDCRRTTGPAAHRGRRHQHGRVCRHHRTRPRVPVPDHQLAGIPGLVWRRSSGYRVLPAARSARIFRNGGQRLYVARVVAANAQFASRHVGPLLIRAVGRGAWGNRIFIRIGRASPSTGTNNADGFAMTLLYYSVMPPVPLVDPLSSEPGDRANPDRREPDLVEQFDGLTHVFGVPNGVQTVVNTASQLVNVTFDGGDPEPVPQGDVPEFVPLGSDGSDGDRMDSVEDAYAESLAALETVDDVALLAVPDEVRFATAATAGSVTAAVIAQCERRKDRFAIISAARGISDVSQLKTPRDTAWAAFYYPWIDDPRSGHRGQPADTARGTHRRRHRAHRHRARRAQGARERGDPERRRSRVSGHRSARRTSSTRAASTPSATSARPGAASACGARARCRPIPSGSTSTSGAVRSSSRSSIDKGTQWAVFEPNGEQLWANVRRASATSCFSCGEEARCWATSQRRRSSSRSTARR